MGHVEVCLMGQHTSNQGKTIIKTYTPPKTYTPKPLTLNPALRCFSCWPPVKMPACCREQWS